MSAVRHPEGHRPCFYGGGSALGHTEMGPGTALLCFLILKTPPLEYSSSTTYLYTKKQTFSHLFDTYPKLI